MSRLRRFHVTAAMPGPDVFDLRQSLRTADHWPRHRARARNRRRKSTDREATR